MQYVPLISLLASGAVLGWLLTGQTARRQRTVTGSRPHPYGRSTR